MVSWKAQWKKKKKNKKVLAAKKTWKNEPRSVQRIIWERKKIGKEDEEKINNKIYLKKINKKLKNKKKEYAKNWY